MNAAIEFFRDVVITFQQLPSALVTWAVTMDDQTFLRVMLGGLVLLTVVIAKSLK
jgi:hypothetical protein